MVKHHNIGTNSLRQKTADTSKVDALVELVVLGEEDNLTSKMKA